MRVLFVLLNLFLFVYADPDAPFPKDCIGECQNFNTSSKMNVMMKAKAKFWQECDERGECPANTQSSGEIKCVNGYAGEYECCKVDLLSYVSLEDLGVGSKGEQIRGNDIWGWTDPLTNREYAIVTCFDGTSFVDVTEPTNPRVLGYLYSHTTGTSWRDTKVYKDHAFIISEAQSHGMQVFDLTQLRNSDRGSIHNETRAVPQFTETAFYGEFGSSHNIAINEQTGYAYVVGSRTCNAGLHMVDIRNPREPKFAGCFAEDGYVHDTQCVNYRGVDTRFHGREICFCYDEDTLTIVDVTDKSKPVMIAREGYAQAWYTHQGWLLEDGKHLMLNDELDELNSGQPRTRTLLWDISKLDAPFLKSDFLSSQRVIDHNLYILGDRAYLSNYCGGLRIYDVSGADSGVITEDAFFDVAPTCSDRSFLGSWSAYVYFPSKTIVVNSIERGLFVLKYNKDAPAC